MQILEISQLNLPEYARVLASWHVLINPQFQCDAQLEELSKRKDAETAIAYEQKRKGCGEVTEEHKVEIDGIRFHSCLCHEGFKDPNLQDHLFLFRSFENGVLAHSGGLRDQPAKYVELMQLISRLKQEYENEMNKGNS